MVVPVTIKYVPLAEAQHRRVHSMHDQDMLCLVAVFYIKRAVKKGEEESEAEGRCPGAITT